MTIRATTQTLAALATLLLGACASQSGSITPAMSPMGETASVSGTAGAGQTVSKLPSPGGYQMSADELALDCKKLTGRTAVRIVQIRDFQSRTQASFLSHGMQTVWKPVNGGRGEGSDPDGRYARDRAQLEAYNQRLAEKNCANFDLSAELDPNAKDPPRTRQPNKS